MKKNSLEFSRRSFIKAVIAGAAGMCLAPLSSLTAMASHTGETGQIMGNDVNLRAQPSTDATSLKKLNLGDQVTIIEEVGDWYKVMSGSTTGYVMADLVFVSTVTDRIAYTSIDGVNLRGGASESSYVITTISAGHPVRIQQMVGEWYFVCYESEYGYVRRDMVTLTNMSGVGGSATLLKFGMEGSEVKKLQNELARRNFISNAQVTGYYGSITRDAVKKFQEAANMSVADGVAGPETLEMVYDRSNGIHLTIAQSSGVARNVRLIDWWKGGSDLLARPGGIATVTDVKTGRSFKIRRSGGNKHFDVHPLTAEDTAIMKKNYGGRWSWDRRAIWLSIGSRTYAASQNGMPHSPDPSSTDNYAGHFCIHLLNSRTHGSNSVCPQHQSCIQYAYKKGNE